MAVKIKLKRIGKIRVPQYRIVVADARTARGGRAIEEVGIYHPKEDPSVIRVESERVQYWLSVGAQPTEPVMALLKITGDWQRFKGLPGSEGTLKVAEAKVDRKQIFEAAAKEAVGEKDRLDGVKARAAKKAADAREAAKAPTAEAAPDASPEAPPEPAKGQSGAAAEAVTATPADNGVAETPAAEAVVAAPAEDGVQETPAAPAAESGTEPAADGS